MISTIKLEYRIAPLFLPKKQRTIFNQFNQKWCNLVHFSIKSFQHPSVLNEQVHTYDMVS